MLSCVFVAVAGWLPVGRTVPPSIVAPTRAAAIMMGAKRSDVSRRDVLDGSSLTKQFYDPEGFRSRLPPGWSPALVLAIGAASANYGSSVRSKLFVELQVLGSGVKNQGKELQVPRVTISPARANGQVSVEITPSSERGSSIDYIWASDADTGEVFAGKQFSPAQTSPCLVILVARGRRLVPSVYSTVDGVWEGEAIVADLR